MKNVTRLVLAVFAASGVPGLIVMLAIVILPNPANILGFLLLAPMAVPVAIIFGAKESALPAAGLGLALFALSHLSAWARHLALWLVAGAIAGALLTRLLDESLPPFVDNRVTLVAAICGASAMLAFWLVAAPQHLPPPLLPKAAALVVVGCPFLALASCLVTEAVNVQRDRFAIPDNARLFAQKRVRPRTVSLFEYVDPDRLRHQTTGRSLTLRTDERHPDTNNSIVTDWTVSLSRRELIANGADADASSPPRSASRDAVSVSLAIPTDVDRQSVDNAPERLRTYSLGQGASRRIDPACDLIWLTHRSNYEDDEAVSLAPSLQPVKIDCGKLTGTSMMRFFYRGTLAHIWLRPSAVCRWKQHRATIIRALDGRVVITDTIARVRSASRPAWP